MTAPRSRALLAAALGLLLVGAVPGRAAGAAERFLAPVQDRYEPGDVATMVGYVSERDLPVAVTLRIFGAPASVERSSAGAGLVRLFLTVPIPADAEAGEYGVVAEPGGLVAGSIHVGLEPPEPPRRVWPPGEPEIVNLSPGTPVVPPTTQPPPAPPPTPPPVATTVPAEPPRTPVTVSPTAGEDANVALLLTGSAVAVLCIGLVLLAMRES